MPSSRDFYLYRLRSFLIFLLFIACTGKEKVTDKTIEPGTSVPLRYAEGFKVTDVDGGRLVEVTYPFQGALSGYKYLLVDRGDTVPPHSNDTRVINIPIRSIVCTSTTHIPMLDYLGETKKLIGFPMLDYISSKKMRERIDSGKVAELGVDKGMNIEQLAVLNPDVVMGYMLSGDYGQYKKIEELGMSVVMNGEYLEKHPLGRAEWIKFVALFFNKEQEADSIFDEIEKSYLATTRLVDSVKERPTVLSGIVYGDGWFLPGGKNYAAHLLQDAGCDYLWKDDSSNGFLQLSFESVYEKAYNADLWIGVGSYASLKELKDADQRYAKFKPFKEGNVYTYNARIGAKGGNEYLELGYLRPDIILKDLVKIAHPSLLPSYELFFHRKIQ
ncbi:MAG TPA: ABC transporter substrate-binding protein [Cyclobacteriaceae bacterium]|nr:ABC transporter substrate-binding protein [Cyclobacteriaceae bacterium]